MLLMVQCHHVHTSVTSTYLLLCYHLQRLLTCLHDICSIICARAKLNCPILQASGGSGGGQARRRQGSPPILNAYSTGLSADWGGLERISEFLGTQVEYVFLKEC